MMLFNLSQNELWLAMATCLLALGAILILIGVIVLISRVLSGDVHKIAVQTTELAEKGVAEEVAGLVGNASTLIESLNQLVKTAAGIGVFLIILGSLMIASAYWLTLQIN